MEYIAAVLIGFILGIPCGVMLMASEGEFDLDLDDYSGWKKHLLSVHRQCGIYKLLLVAMAALVFAFVVPVAGGVLLSKLGFDSDNAILVLLVLYMCGAFWGKNIRGNLLKQRE